MFVAKMWCHHLECLNHHSLSPVPTDHGHGRGHGHGGGCVAAHIALNLEEEVPPAEEQHVEEPILEEPGVAQPRGEDAQL